MRALLTLLVASTLLANSATADAPQQPTVQQIDDVQGTYKLSDNRRVEVFALGTRLYVRIGHGPQRELVLAGQNRFAARDGSIAIQFAANFDTDRIVLEHDRGIGQLDTIRMASAKRAGRGSAD
jgi:hypothetical protein